MPEENETPDDTATQHTEASTEEDETTEELSEEECDEAIGQLLAEIAALRAELDELREHHAAHEREYEHVRKPEHDESATDVEPVERHFYFRRISRG